MRWTSLSPRQDGVPSLRGHSVAISLLYQIYIGCVLLARDESKNGDLRSALIEAAAQLIATEGASGLTLRRGAGAVGTSAVAVYTHFGGMAQLRRGARPGGFAGRAVVSLQLTRVLSDQGALRSLGGAIVNLFIAFGDEPQRARRSLARVAAVGAAA